MCSWLLPLCYDLILPVFRFLVDALLLLLLTSLLLGTSIEALVVSVLIYFEKVNLDIDFEREVRELLIRVNSPLQQVSRVRYVVSHLLNSSQKNE